MLVILRTCIKSEQKNDHTAWKDKWHHTENNRPLSLCWCPQHLLSAEDSPGIEQGVLVQLLTVFIVNSPREVTAAANLQNRILDCFTEAWDTGNVQVNSDFEFLLLFHYATIHRNISHWKVSFRNICSFLQLKVQFKDPKIGDCNAKVQMSTSNRWKWG